MEPSGFVVKPLQTPRTRCDLHAIPLMTWPPRSSWLGLGFVAQPRDPVVLWQTTANPVFKLQLLATTLHQIHVLDFILPPYGPHLIPSATGSLVPRLLVSQHLGGLTCIDLSQLFFTCTNKNQAASYTCNTRTRVSLHHVVNHSSIRSDHPPVLGRTQVLKVRPLVSL
jgi:hypothetical protein